jgi:protein dithiol:quinone oxidoreductase
MRQTTITSGPAGADSNRGLAAVCGFLSGISARNRFLLVAAGAFGLLGAGLALGVALNLHPCPLCIFQRVLYLVVGFAALLGALRPDLQKIRWAAAGVGIAAAVGGIATAAYQTWMQLFPGSLMECGYAEPNLIERLVDWLGMQWEFMFLATGLCSSKEWTFLGLSMANWSIPCFLVFAGMLVWAARGRAVR